MATLVTGATGLLGNNIVRVLLERGERVRVLARETSDPRPLEGMDVEIARGDIRDAHQVRVACEGMDAVIHAAGWVRVGWTGIREARSINVDGTRNVADAAREVGARMVHVSTMNALGVGDRHRPADEDTPRSGQVACPYTVTKRDAEQVVQQRIARGLAAVIVNPGFLLGPWDWKPSSGRMLLEIATRFTPVAPRGGLSVCDVRDVAAATICAVEKGQTGRNYILAGHNMPYIDLWRLMADVSGTRRPWWRVSRIAMFLGGRGGDVLSKLYGRELDINSAALQITAQYHYYSSQRAEAELDYQTRPALDSVRAAWKWF